jgi:hypothetical protein
MREEYTAPGAISKSQNSDRNSRINGWAWRIAATIMHDAGWRMPPEIERFYDRHRERVWLCMAIAADQGWME